MNKVRFFLGIAALGLGFLAVTRRLLAPRRLPFAGLWGYALAEGRGEAAQGSRTGHNGRGRESGAGPGGREGRHAGGGTLAAFPSAVRAVQAAIQIQRDLAGGEVRVRIGLNAGEPIAEDDDFFGTVVQLAARICDRADPGQVLVSRVVADLCAGKKLSFQPVGDAHMKGFDEPVALFEAGG